MADQLGARKNGTFKAICTAPSFNKTPVGPATPPVPYPVLYDLSGSVGTVDHVRFNGDPAYVLDQSTQTRCIGDSPGTAGGIRSGTVGGEVKPVSGSGSVKIAGKQVVRAGDSCMLNGGNCPGIYVAVSAASPRGTSGLPARAKTPSLLKNKEQGDAFAKRKTEEFKKTATHVENEITVKTKTGTRTRLDAIGRDSETGQVRIQEYKSSQKAPLTRNQSLGFPDIENSGAEVVGEGKGEFGGGTKIPPIRIEIIRPKG